MIGYADRVVSCADAQVAIQTFMRQTQGRLCILVKLFSLFLRHGHVPAQFGQSYTVPIMKGSISSHRKNLTTDDFRGISISPVISKVFRPNRAIARSDRFGLLV